MARARGSIRKRGKSSWEIKCDMPTEARRAAGANLGRPGPQRRDREHHEVAGADQGGGVHQAAEGEARPARHHPAGQCRGRAPGALGARAGVACSSGSAASRPVPTRCSAGTTARRSPRTT
jgi:hypothetical protein